MRLLIPSADEAPVFLALFSETRTTHHALSDAKHCGHIIAAQ
jgi:hypothetical protein